METKLNPYLTFKDNARQAMEFYHGIFGGDLTMRTFKEFNAAQNPAEENNIMHAELDGKDGLVLMASDTANQMGVTPGNNITMSLTGDNEKELKGYFEKLSAGGKVNMPLKKEVWGDTFGMLTDKFGINWMVNISAPKAG